VCKKSISLLVLVLPHVANNSQIEEETNVLAIKSVKQTSTELIMIDLQINHKNRELSHFFPNLKEKSLIMRMLWLEPSTTPKP